MFVGRRCASAVFQACCVTVSVPRPSHINAHTNQQPIKQTIQKTNKQTNTDRQTHRQTDRRQTDRQAGRQTGRQADGQTGRQAGRQTGRQADRQTGRQAPRQADRQTNRPTDQTNKPTDQQTNSQTDRQTDKQTKTNGDSETRLFATRRPVAAGLSIRQSLLERLSKRVAGLPACPADNSGTGSCWDFVCTHCTQANSALLQSCNSATTGTSDFGILASRLHLGQWLGPVPQDLGISGLQEEQFRSPEKSSCP